MVVFIKLVLVLRGNLDMLSMRSDGVQWYCLCFIALFSVAGITQACDCISPSPEGDKRILAKAAVIGRFEVHEVAGPDWSTPGKAPMTITLKIEQIYRGFIDYFTGGLIMAHNDMAKGCSRVVKKGETLDLILLSSADGFVLANQCMELSEAGWATLKRQPPNQ